MNDCGKKKKKFPKIVETTSGESATESKKLPEQSIGQVKLEDIIFKPNIIINDVILLTDEDTLTESADERKPALSMVQSKPNVSAIDATIEVSEGKDVKSNLEELFRPTSTLK